MSKIIEKISIKNYRGIKDPHDLELAEQGKITFLIGPNNSGKSLVARIFTIFDVDITQYDSHLFSIPFTDKDFYNFNVNDPIIVKFTINTERFSSSQDADLFQISKLKQVNLSFTIRKYNGLFNCCLHLIYGDTSSHLFNDVNQRYEYNEQFSSVSTINKISKDKVERICTKLFNVLKSKILIFDSIRSFDRILNSSFYKSGSELVNWLNENKNPSETTKVRSLLSNWLKNEFNLDAPVAINADIENKQLIFTFHNYLELSSKEIGTGYTMLCILLMEIARGSKEFIVIDELESHLQPGLVRVLIKLLRGFSSQYLIATHSPTAIEASVFDDFLYRFSKRNEMCTFEGFFRRDSKDGRSAKILREVANELGIVPGDALLSNAVIWVEGPSEVFWVRAWLKSYFEIYKRANNIQNNIIEGLHYAILMTGGNNIAHYSYSENEIEISDLDIEHKLNVLRVNPNPFVIIDSDNTNNQSKKYKRMQQIAIELKEQNKLHPLFRSSSEANFNINNLPNLWVLKGRELENYAHPSLIFKFYKGLNDSRQSKVTGLTESINWDVFSLEKGVGTILEEQGIQYIAESSGTIKHKSQLARFMFENLNEDHFNLECEFQSPNPEMLDDLTKNLDKLVKYILLVNSLF
ncbi:AAA family ATPase [Paenibacillus sp. FSL W8-0186]|uniref:ATP-dependent nuclease n=1 Tax=Paenibacillus sp. FSL W8-0186 TaxID=2921709 RepID=UPI0030D337BC